MGRSADLYKTLYRSQGLVPRVHGLMESGSTHRPLWLSVVESNPPEPDRPCSAGVAPSLVWANTTLYQVFKANFPVSVVAPAFVRLKTDSPTELKRFCAAVHAAQAQLTSSDEAPVASSHPAVKTTLAEFAEKYALTTKFKSKSSVSQQDTFTLTRFFAILDKPSGAAPKKKRFGADAGATVANTSTSTNNSEPPSAGQPGAIT